MGALRPGDESAHGGTIVAAIEDAYDELLVRAGKDPLPTDPDSSADRRRMFAAIARGIVRHLRDNPDAFAVTDPARQLTIDAGQAAVTDDAHSVEVEIHADLGLA